MLSLVRIQTEYLDPAEYGYLTLCLTIVLLFNQTLVGGLSSGFARFFSVAKNNGNVFDFMVACNSMLFTVSIICVLILFATVAFFSLTIKLFSFAILIYILLYSLCSNYNSSCNSVQNAARNRSVVAFSSGVESWLKVFFLLVLITYFRDKAEAVVFSYFISSLVVNFLQFYFLKFKLDWYFGISLWQLGNEWCCKILKFSWPISLWGIFTWLQISSGRWSLEAFCETSAVGHFAVLYQLGFVPIGFVLGLFVNLIYPMIYQRAGDANNTKNNLFVNKLIWKITFITLTLTLICALFTCLTHGFIFDLLVSEAYREFSIYLPLMIFAGGIVSTGQILCLKLMSDIKTNCLLPPKIGSALIGIILSFLGAYVFQLLGAIISLVLYSITFLLWTFYSVFKHAKI